MSKEKREPKQVEREKDGKRKNRWRNQKWGGKGVLHRWDGWMDRWEMGWTVENPPFVLPPPPPNNVAKDGSTCLLLAQTQVLGGQIESCPDLIPQEVRPVFTTLIKKRGCVFSTCGTDIW